MKLNITPAVSSAPSGRRCRCFLTALLLVATPSAFGQIPPPPTVQPATLTFWEPAPSDITDCSINNRGQVIGTFLARRQGVSNLTGFLLKESALQPFSVPGYRHTSLTGINDRGDMAGYAYERFSDGAVGFIVRDGVTTFLPPIPPPPGAEVFPGYVTGGINNRGVVVGSARFIIDNKLTTLGWIYENGNYTLVRHGQNQVTGLTGINASGDASGYTSVTDGGSSYQPIVYRQGQFSILPAPAPPPSPFITDIGYRATAINSRGEVLVTRPPLGITPTGQSERSYLYRPGRPYVDLTPVGSFENAALSINDQSQICGVSLTAYAQDIHGDFIWRAIGFVRPAP
jgi:hypothetical protein